MRRSILTTLAATVALTATMSCPGPAMAVWTSVSGDVYQLQVLCRDGIVIDLASQNFAPWEMDVYVAPPTAQDPTQGYTYRGTFRPPAVSIGDLPDMWDALGFGVKTLGRNYKGTWLTPLTPGSQMRIRAGITDESFLKTVQDCSVNTRDLFTTGYVLGHKRTPNPATFQPDMYWSYNSTRQTNTITRTGLGTYTVSFPGLARAGGNAHVTTFGPTSAICKIGSNRWFPAGAAMVVDVRCFAPGPTGGPVDARFTASYTGGGGTANTYAFALVDQPSVDGTTTPLASAQYNNRGGPITVTRWTPGRYTVTIPNALGAQDGGSVKVTPVGTNATDCKVQWLGPGEASILAVVLCFGSNGQPTDSQFTIAYMNGMNFLGNNRMSDGYAMWTGYSVPPTYQRSTARGNVGNVSITRVNTGSYDVLLPYQKGGYDSSAGPSWDGGNVQVTAYGSGSGRCQVGYWRNGGPEGQLGRIVRVYCFATSGSVADSGFTMQYTAQIQ